MSSSVLGARQRQEQSERLHGGPSAATAGKPRQLLTRIRAEHPGVEGCFVDLGDVARAVLIFTPRGRGSFAEQFHEMLSALRSVLEHQPQPMSVTTQTVFLRNPEDEAECRKLLTAHFGANLPITNFVLQPPCSGAAAALEVWAIGGPGVQLERFGPHLLAVSYDGLRWLQCGGFSARGGDTRSYKQTLHGLKEMRRTLHQAGSRFEQVMRTWLYLGNITEPEQGIQRYKELNRARSDFYQGLRFCDSLLAPGTPHGVYPASTGIGALGSGLAMSCLALQTRREDAFLLPLENPRQMPAYAYAARYSPQSPKFSRAMALVLDRYVTIWISGTASILDSESCHLGDIEKQTEQAICNIEGLIARKNFAFHGVKGAGARLQDLAKIRVYLKRPEDLARCKAICDQRFGPVPALYVVADICRPELLVEIEGVAFSRHSPSASQPSAPAGAAAK